MKEMFFQSLLLAYRLEKRASLTMHSPSRRADWLNPDASGLSQSVLGFSPGPVGRPKIRWFCASRVGGYIYNYLNIYYCKLLDWLIYSLEEQWGQPSLSNFMLSLLFSSNVTFRRTYNILNKNIYRYLYVFNWSIDILYIWYASGRDTCQFLYSYLRLLWTLDK